MALTDPSADIQTAVAAKLGGLPALAAVIADRIYDRIPNVPTYPLLTFGEMQVLPVDGEGLDGADCSLTLHSWDQYKDFAKSKQIGALVINALHDEHLATASVGTLSVLLTSARYLRDPDGLTTHGVFTFSILTDANAD